MKYFFSQVPLTYDGALGRKKKITEPGGDITRDIKTNGFDRTQNFLVNFLGKKTGNVDIIQSQICKNFAGKIYHLNLTRVFLSFFQN